MKQSVCKWNHVDSAPGDGVRFVGWTEHTPGTDEEPILCVALHRAYGGKNIRTTYRENAARTCCVHEDTLPSDFETMWRIGRRIKDAPENSSLVGHYREHAL